jgi:Nif-specific regulatory protein
MTVGARVGTQFLLEEGRQNRIGRGLDCDVILADPLASRVHAILVCQDGDWWVRDAGSRNGTYVSSQKIDEARLIDGAELKVGSTEFEFRQTLAKPTDNARLDHTQTIIIDRNVSTDEPPAAYGVEALRDNERAHRFSDAAPAQHEAAAAIDFDEVVRVSLELLRERTKASVVGFLWASDDGTSSPSW